MKARLSIMLVMALVMVLVSLLAPAAFAQEQQQNQQRDPNEGEPKHEIREARNNLQQTDDPSRENHLENRIDKLQEQHLEYDYRTLEQRKEEADNARRQVSEPCVLIGIATLGLFPLISHLKYGTPCSLIGDFN